MALSYFSSFLPFLRRLLGPKAIDNHSNLQGGSPAASSTAPLPIRNGTRKLEPVEGSVWEWSARSIAQCPIQPVCNLGDGSSQSNPPAFAIEAYKSALDLVECNQYPPTGGLPRFTSTLAKIYSPLLGRDLDANSEISVHSGGTEAILSILTAFVDRGDEVVVFEPGFDLYELHVRFLGGIIRSVQLHPPASASTRVSSANEWTFDQRELEAAISNRTKILIVNTPHNPLGKVFTAHELATIGDIAIKHNLIVLSDEVYEHLTYGPEFIRLASLSPAYAAQTITVHSIGKAFNATGWRIGYATGPSDLIRRVKNAHIILSFTTAGPAQAAAAASLEEAQRNGFWDTNRAKMAKNIEIMCQVFEELGLPYVKPMGAHYLMLNAGKIKVPKGYTFPAALYKKTRDWRLSWFVLMEVGVATIPSSASFNNTSSVVTENYLRFVVGKPEAELREAGRRLLGLKQFL